MPVLDVLILVVAAYYGLRAVAGIARAVLADDGGGLGPGARTLEQDAASVRWPTEPEIEDARWVDLEEERTREAAE